MKMSGNIYDKNNKIVGSYGYSFSACTFSWVINGGNHHHFYHKDEMLQEFSELGYHIKEDKR